MQSNTETAAEKILQRINEICAEKEKVIVAIDGRCASGKTTLAAAIEKLSGCSVIHMDDFFLRPEQRTAERLALAGGNIDYERFETEVLLPLKSGCDFSYRPYNCHDRSLGEAVSCRNGRVTVIEGSYSCHPALRRYYDLSIFLSITPEVQLERIRIRNGRSAENFQNIWIPMEEKYFSEHDVKNKCDMYFEM